MRTESYIERIQNEAVGEKSFAVDTSFVLFFLAVEFGRTLFSTNLDNIFMFFTLLMVAVFPYFHLSDERPGFANWFLGRTLIAGFAILLGAMFKQSLGVVLPETFRFLPMTLLIITTMICCCIQFYSFFNLRLAK